MRSLSTLAALLVASSAAHEVNERAGADFVQRSLDKTIIVVPGGETQTVPGGEGTRVFYPTRETEDRHDHDHDHD